MLILIAHQDVPRVLFGATVALVGVVLSLETRWWYWAGIAVTVNIWNFTDWTVIDDHVALGGFWFIAMALGLRTPDPDAAWGSAARWLIAATFLSAVGWKLGSQDFRSFSFYEYTLLKDPRFVPISSTLGRVSSALLAENRQAVDLVGVTTVLASSAQIELIARLMTFGTIVVELAVALTQVFQHRWRHAALGVFMVGAYGIVPVLGFGSVLIAMGAATSKTESERRVYVAGLLVLTIWSVIRQVSLNQVV